MINAMMTERSEEFRKIEEEEKGDWESRLRELTAKFDSEMSMGKKSGKYKKNEDIKVMVISLIFKLSLKQTFTTFSTFRWDHFKFS